MSTEKENGGGLAGDRSGGGDRNPLMSGGPVGYF